MLKSIKALSKDEELYALINTMMGIRNKASHGCIAYKDMKKYYALLCDEELLVLLNSLGVDEQLKDSIKSVKVILLNRRNPNYKEQCIYECKYLLLNLKLSLEEVVSLLKDKYDISTINSCIVEVLHNQHVV